MKTYKIPLILLACMLAILPSCSDDTFEKNYYDPEKSVEATIEGLYPGLLYNHRMSSNNTIFPRYWNFYTFVVPMLGTYSQTNGYLNGSSVYDQQTNYTQDRWNYYFTSVVASYNEMLKIYDGLSDQEQIDGYRIFMETSRIFLYDQSAQMVDLWGHIPFSEAGKLNYTGGELILPKYDKDEEIYDFILNDLKRISDYLNSMELSGSYQRTFERADLLNQGNISRWKIYANSLRLRLAMRISNAQEGKAQQIVSEILGNPGQYPVIENNQELVQFEARGRELNSLVNQHGQGIKESLEGRPAPGKMVNEIMVPSNDPRLPVMFSKNKYGEYKGVFTDWNQTRQSDSLAANYFSRLDTATYGRNDKFPGIIITAAEISFLKAEAAERWGVGGSAEAHYNQGLKQSIAFLYYINSLNDNVDGTSFTPKTPPTAAQIDEFLNHPNIKYEGSQAEKLEKIGTQNWLNFGIIQAHHAWAEYRRTKYPLLQFEDNPLSNLAVRPPSRLFYPEKEKVLNINNYQEVASYDLANSKVFWDAKP